MQYYSQIYGMLFIDQLKTTIELDSYPKRIVSLVPSQSELLWDLGLTNELVGITKFCIHPEDLFKNMTKVGGTKTLNVQKIIDLNPDLIIGNKEENEQSQIIELKKHVPVWMSDIYNLSDTLLMIESLGEITNKQNEATNIKNQIAQSFLQLKTTSKSVLYLIWKNPFMAAGTNTFINDMLLKMGLKNVLNQENSRYPELSIEDMIHLNPEVIFLSSEPYPFKELDINFLHHKLPNTQILLVDGEMFSWYGSRLLKSSAYFNQLIDLHF